MRQLLSLATVLLVVTTAVDAGSRRHQAKWAANPSVLHPWSLHVPYNDHEKMTICSTRPVPPGWVVVGQRYSLTCPGHCPNVLVIEKLSTKLEPEMIICACQPVPVGWVAVSEEHTKFCDGHGKNALRIRRQ